MAAPLFFELANALGQAEKLQDQIHPALQSLSLTRIPVCMQTGAAESCGNDRAGWFIPGKSPFQLADVASRKPQILSPRSGVTYVASRASKVKLQIPLQARHGSENGERLFWFAGTKYLGENNEAQPILWEPSAGTHIIRLVDESGQADSQRIQILTSE